MANPETLTGEAHEASSEDDSHGSVLGLTVGAIGIVFGDIGTSPLYALKESLAHVKGGGVARDEVIGICSLLFWALIITVTIKYVIFLMRADNRGEGGTLTLLALSQKAMGRRSALVFFLGITGAALFYGDAIITPAISVLSATEGLKLVAPALQTYVVPIAIAILCVLFAVQKTGTGRVAAMFGPVMLVWFATLALLGVYHIADDPQIFLAILPYYAIDFFLQDGFLAFVVLGSVVLAVTGGEALYSDMGHFGKGPIRIGWLVIVLPALMLNYFGQGAMVLHNPETAENSFFLMAPDMLRWPLVILATLAAIIASQAVITGAFSLTRQAIQLGLLPRLRVRHTSEKLMGQIFIPEVNALIFVGVILLVLTFRSSSALASAYGIAVTGAMAVDTVLGYIVARRLWGWSQLAALAVVVPLLLIDIAFLSSNMLKFFDGGYLPLALGTCLMLAMWTWSRGSQIVAEKTRRHNISLKDLCRMLKKSSPPRVEGTAVFLTSDPEVAPSALMHNLKHNRVLHKHNILFTVKTSTVPRVPKHEQIEMKDLGDGMLQITAHVGYMQDPDVPKLLQLARRRRADIDPQRASYFMGRTRLIADPNSGMPFWQDKLFIGLSTIASDATEYFRIPSGRAVELGNQIVI